MLMKVMNRLKQSQTVAGHTEDDILGSMLLPRDIKRAYIMNLYTVKVRRMVETNIPKD